MKLWKEFKEFAFKGNVIDLAVGVIIGSRRSPPSSIPWSMICLRPCSPF